MEIARSFAVVFEHTGRAVSNEEAGAALTPALAAGTVITTNAFFTDIGLLVRPEDGPGFKPGPELIEFSKTLQWDEPGAREKLRPLFARTWFYRCLAPRLKLTDQSKKSCIATLATESSAANEHEIRLNNLLSFLKFAGLISINGDMIGLDYLTSPSLLSVPPGGPVRDQNGVGDLLKPPASVTNPEAQTLYLDAKRERRVTLEAPLSISRAEYNRLIKWIEVTLIVGDDVKSEQKASQ